MDKLRSLEIGPRHVNIRAQLGNANADRGPRKAFEDLNNPRPLMLNPETFEFEGINLELESS
jgi:hypothetical protein